MSIFNFGKISLLRKIQAHFKPHRLLFISADYITNMADENRPISYHKKCFLVAYYIYMITYMIRLVLAALVLNNLLLPRSYLRVDLFIGFLIKVRFIDRYLALVLSPIFLLLLFVDYTVHFRCGLHSFHLAYDIIVTNKQNFTLLNPQLNWQNIRHKSIKSVCKNINVTNHSLTHFPGLQHSIRQRAILLSFTFDILMAIFVIYYSLICIFGLSYFYLNTVWAALPFAQGLLVITESSMVVYTAWHSTKIGFFLAHFTGMIIFVLSRQLVIALKRLERLLKEVRRQSSKSSSATGNQLLDLAQHRLASFYHGYLRLHHKLFYDLSHCNAEVNSPSLLLTLLTVFGFNIYSATLLIVKELSQKMRALVFAANYMVPLFLYLAIHPMITVRRLMQSSQLYLHRSQVYLGNSNADVRLKLKLAGASDRRFAFTVGPVGKVTTNQLVKVCAFVLFVNFNCS